MRTNIAMIVLALLLVAMCSVCIGRMAHRAQELTSCAQAAADALPNDPETTRQRLAEFESLWQKTEPHWQFIAIHEDLEEVSLALRETQDALLTDDLSAAKAACDRISEAVETILHKELPTPGNIF